MAVLIYLPPYFSIVFVGSSNVMLHIKKFQPVSDAELARVCDDALQTADMDGFAFVKFVVEETDLDLPQTKKRLKTSLFILNQLTPEQIAELRKEDE